jgi:hypothetical protein
LALDDTGVGAAVGDIFVNDGKLSPQRQRHDEATGIQGSSGCKQALTA